MGKKRGCPCLFDLGRSQIPDLTGVQIECTSFIAY
jgi:hypothetical protein